MGADIIKRERKTKREGKGKEEKVNIRWYKKRKDLCTKRKEESKERKEGDWGDFKRVKELKEKGRQVKEK